MSDLLDVLKRHPFTNQYSGEEVEELSQVYNVSRERIRQIEVRAFEKLQKAMKAIAGERLLPAAA